MIELTNEFQSETEKVLESLKKELIGVRTNRPTAGLIEDIKVQYYNKSVPIKHLGSIGVKLPREIYVQVWDGSVVQFVAKAIESSPLGLSPQVKGNLISVYLPELSDERRQEFIKHIKKITEEKKIQIRHMRDDINKKIQKLFDGNELTEDEKFKEKEDVQKIVDKVNKEIESVLDLKIKEIQL